MEESLTLKELELIVKTIREQEKRMMTFQAAIKGIDLNKDSADETKKKFQETERRAQLINQNKSEEEISRAMEQSSFNDFGIDFE